MAIESISNSSLYDQIANNQTPIVIEGADSFRSSILRRVRQLTTTAIGSELLERIIRTGQQLLIRPGTEWLFDPENRTIDGLEEEQQLYYPVRYSDGNLYFTKMSGLIALPHEMIHALHEAEGESPPKISPCPEWGDEEERYAITGISPSHRYNRLNEWEICRAYGEHLRQSYYCSHFLNHTEVPANECSLRLIDAAGCGATGNLKQILAMRDIDIEARAYPASPLLLAVERGFYKCAQILLENGAQVNAYREGQTVLHKAVSTNYICMIELVCHHGANIHALTEAGDSVMHLSTDCKTLSHLIKAGANVNLKNRKGETALDLAVLAADAPRIQLLSTKHQ